jgi:hypothetical protein
MQSLYEEDENGMIQKRLISKKKIDLENQIVEEKELTP